MAEREKPRALVLLRIVADGLRDPIRHVKYPDEERCARCGGKWPCPNGAFDELRAEIKRLADLQRQLQQAQEELAGQQALAERLRSASTELRYRGLLYREEQTPQRRMNLVIAEQQAEQAEKAAPAEAQEGGDGG